MPQFIYYYVPLRKAYSFRDWLFSFDCSKDQREAFLRVCGLTIHNGHIY